MIERFRTLLITNPAELVQWGTNSFTIKGVRVVRVTARDNARGRNKKMQCRRKRMSRKLSGSNETAENGICKGCFLAKEKQGNSLLHPCR